MRIFLSYSSKDREVADEIHLALMGAGHGVFFDHYNLGIGADYHSRIRKEIAESDTLIFLISPYSVRRGSYALSELKFAKKKWPKPWGKVLPVMIIPTEYKRIDKYLTASTILEPAGNVAAEVAAAIEGLPGQKKKGAKAPSEREREIVGSLLTFLEDRRLLTDDTGYQSHFPDYLRQSAQVIRQCATSALQRIGRDSKLTPILKRIQRGARKFQEATEGAMDGHRAGGGFTPYVPMGLKDYFRSLEVYRQEMAEGMIEAAHCCGFELDSDLLRAFETGQARLRSFHGSE